MFGDRPDGRRIKKVDPMQLITGFLMKKRYDSMNMYEDTLNCAAWDMYIKEKGSQGIKMGYMHIFIAGIVRMLALYPRLNRFVMNGKLYARPKIWVSFTIHPELQIESPDTTIKLEFEGKESILEIADRINEAIRKETVLRTEENHNWLMLLNILIDICGGWFIIGYVSLCVLPQKKLLSCLAKGKYYIEGSVIEVSQQSVRYMGLDCCEVHLAERRLFLPEDTLSLDAGEKYRFLLCGDIIVEVSSEDES